MMKKIQIFNSPEEVGARILFILVICQKGISKQRIMYYDYFSLHLNDLDQTLSSLHPDNPNHSSEIAIKRELINKGLDIVIAKGLVDIEYSKTGIYYCSNGLTHSFVNVFKNSYVEELKKNINIVNEHFSNYSDREIYQYINRNIGKWAGEIENSAFTRGE